MKDLYECTTCGMVTETKGHLCQPEKLENRGDYCGQPVDYKTGKMCGKEIKRFEFECSNCGRPAEQADLVCAPKKIL